MSAVVWEETRRYAASGATAPQPTAGERPGRPHLTLVPTGPASTRGHVGLRLTRRGRIVVAVLLLALAVGIGGILDPGGTGTAPAPHTVVVSSGQTLSEIAARELPELSPAQAMTAIRVANNLPTTTISAGQRLVIPRS